MQRKGILPHKDTYHDEPKCSFPVHFKGMKIVDIPFYNMSCHSISGKLNAKTMVTDIKRIYELATGFNRLTQINNLYEIKLSYLNCNKQDDNQFKVMFSKEMYKNFKSNSNTTCFDIL